MTRFLCDENFNNDILRGILRDSNVDVVRVQDIRLTGSDDQTILDAAARQGRILLTHDFDTMVAYAYQRVTSGLPMPGLIVVNQHLPIGEAISDLVLLAECSREGEWEGHVCYLPLS